MAFDLLAKVYLATLLNVVGSVKSDVCWDPSIESEGVNIFNSDEDKEVENGTVKDAISNCDNHSSSLSNVPACSSAWTYFDNGTCKCADTKGVLCLLSAQSLVGGGYCVTFDSTQALTQLGECVYSLVEDKDGIVLLQYYLPSNVSELDDVMCGPFKRTGMLCGKCKDGYYPLVNSLDMNCVQCPNGWSNLWKFVMVAFLPLTVFYFIILLFRVNATSSQLHGFVYCCQGIAFPALMRAELIFAIDKNGRETTVRILGVLYGIWNLDFLRSLDFGICLPVDTLTTLALDVAVGVYPLLLIIIDHLFSDRTV